jgi:6-phosphogluconolactonase (cycloisomerase 2 family)
MSTNDLSRRTVVAGVIAAGGLLMSADQRALAKDRSRPKGGQQMSKAAAMYAYVGCRTTKERKARGEGINVYAMNSSTGEWKHIQLVKGLENPSYLAFDRDRKFLYTVHGDMQAVSAFKVDPSAGTLTFINERGCGGKNPVHLVPDVTNKFMIVANYASGSVGVLPINADGSLGQLGDVAKLPGQPGPHKTQQQSLHPHMIAYDRAEKFIAVPDKGGDQVCVYRFDASTGKMVANDPPRVKSREGAGPRHIVFHPTKSFAYLVNELDSTIGVYAYDANKEVLKPLQILPATPSSFTGDNTSAGIAIAPSGKFVYMSNRGHDSIAIYAVNETSGLLSSVGWESTRGGGPRFFTLDPSGQLLYAANELTDTVVTFRVDGRTGKLTPTGQVIQTGSPTCVVFWQGRA